MAYRMVAIDLDGTLLSPDGTVSERNRAAVHKALAAGLLVCFATGRNYTESRTILEAVGHYDTAVFVGGALVIDTRDRRTVHRMGMEAQLARDVSRELEALGHATLALQDNAESGVDYLVTAEAPLNEATRQWMRLTSAKVQLYPRLADHPHGHTIRVGIVAPTPETALAKQRLEERFGERILCQVLHVPAYAVEVLEVFDPSVNKWQGILHVARAHGVRPEQIVAIGDDVNDIAMVRNAGLGVAMGNAKEELKALARRVIGPNSEDGLAAFLEELVETGAVTPEG